MTFAQAIKTCFNRYATFTGRATRSEYWWWILFCFLSIIAICIIAALIGVATAGSRGVGLFGFFFLLPFIIFCIVILVPSWAVLFRRLHDAGHPGYWILLYLVPCTLCNILICRVGRFANNEHVVRIPLLCRVDSIAGLRASAITALRQSVRPLPGLNSIRGIRHK